jgi:hypothetical protein
MNKKIRLGAGVWLAVLFVACSSGGGIFQPPKSSGVIVAREVGSSIPLATSANNPLIVNGAFSIVLSEANYSATFTAEIVSYTAPATESCYGVTMDGTGTVATFTPRSAPATNGGSVSPCSQSGIDLEEVLFKDQQQHSNEQFFEFESQPPTTSSAIQARLTSTGMLLSTSLSNPLVVVGGFSVSLSELNYTGPFSATIVSFTAPTTESCYTVAMDASQTVAIFTPRAAPPISAPPSPAPTSQCGSPDYDTETVLFEDQRGNVNEQFFNS